VPTGVSRTGCVGSLIPPAAHAAASMFATGAMRSAESTAAVIYVSSRRASNSRLIAEISVNNCWTDSLNATRWPTKPASVSGT
jgi:hypothetical protein